MRFFWRRMPLLLLFLLPFSAEGYERIVSLKPGFTEILFALGLGEKVVGVTDYCKYPPEARKKPKIGGYSNPALEKILELRPDLVGMTPDTTPPKIESAIQRAGIETLVVKTNTLQDIYEAIQTVANRTGVPAKGSELVDTIKVQIHREQKRVPQTSKKGMIVIQRSPLIVVGSRNFLDDLMKIARIENIAGHSALPYPQYSMEVVLEQRPEVIVDIDPAPAGDFWSRYASLPAVQSGSVFHLPPDLFVPGPRVPETLAVLMETVYR